MELTDSSEDVVLRCYIPHCKIEVKEIRTTKRLPKASSCAGTGCINEFMYHDHDSKILYEAQEPNTRDRFK